MFRVPQSAEVAVDLPGREGGVDAGQDGEVLDAA